MSKENKKIPDFSTFQEAREFWEKHSLADFAGELEEAKEVKFIRKGNLVVSLKLEEDDENRLRQLAKKRGVKYSDLITSWVKEHLRES
ncbi:MAG: CopG family antitoxin [Bacillota bacterium]|nr:CopG family antitoxin [Bacillota bacterium]